jgi:hypothetical protein
MGQNLMLPRWAKSDASAMGQNLLIFQGMLSQNRKRLSRIPSFTKLCYIRVSGLSSIANACQGGHFGFIISLFSSLQLFGLVEPISLRGLVLLLRNWQISVLQISVLQISVLQISVLQISVLQISVLQISVAANFGSSDFRQLQLSEPAAFEDVQRFSSCTL